MLVKAAGLLAGAILVTVVGLAYVPGLASFASSKLEPPSPRIMSEQMQTGRDQTANDYVAMVYVTVQNDGGPGEILVSTELNQQNVGRWVKDQRVQLLKGESRQLSFYFPEVSFTPQLLSILGTVLGKGGNSSSNGGLSYKVSARAAR